MTAALFGVLKCGTLVNAARRTLGKIPSSRRTIMRKHTLSGPTWRPLVGLWCGAQPTFLHNLTAHDLDIRAWQAYTKFLPVQNLVMLEFRPPQEWTPKAAPTRC